MEESQIVPFSETALEPQAPGIAARAVPINGVRWAVVQYEPDILREQWCHEGHSGFVIEGEVVYEFEDGRQPLAAHAAQGFTLAGGSGHRGRSGPNGVRLFLIDRPT